MTSTDKGMDLYLVKFHEGSNLCWKTAVDKEKGEPIMSFRLNNRVIGREKSEAVENGGSTNTTIIIGQFIKSLKPKDVLTIIKLYNI